MWRNFDFIAAPRIEMHQSDCFFYHAFDQWKANGNIHLLPQRFALIMQLYNGGAKKKECLFHIVLIRKNNAEIFAFGINKPTGYIPNIINTFCLLFICSTVQFYIKNTIVSALAPKINNFIFIQSRGHQRSIYIVWISNILRAHYGDFANFPSMSVKLKIMNKRGLFSDKMAALWHRHCRLQCRFDIPVICEVFSVEYMYFFRPL